MEYVIFFLLVWLGVYGYSRNKHSKVAQLFMWLMILIAIFFVGDFITRETTDYGFKRTIWDVITGTYVISTAILFHLSVVLSKDNRRYNTVLLWLVYGLALFIYAIALFTNLYIRNDIVLGYSENFGWIYPRGQLFFLQGVLIAISVGGGLLNIINSKIIPEMAKKMLALSYGLYLVIGISLVVLYYFHELYDFLFVITPYLFSIPLIPALIAVFIYRYPEDLGQIINKTELVYNTILLAVIVLIFLGLAELSTFDGNPEEKIIKFSLITLVILSHSFYDTFLTYIRDLTYNRDKGFSIITDTDTQFIVNNFHNPHRLSESPILKFSCVKSSKMPSLDASQQLVREAIEYFKQPDYPRRTKQNLKYHILKMSALDEGDEGQLLWELGFEGYPMRILNNQDSTRSPLFKIESMSDYTAVSRNAFFALKKEAIHDLTWRLSYLEKNSNKK